MVLHLYSLVLALSSTPLTGVAGRDSMVEMSTEEQLLTYKEAAEYLKVSVDQVYRYVKDKTNPLPRIVLSPGSIRIRREDLLAWVSGVFDNPNNEIADREGGEN